MDVKEEFEYSSPTSKRFQEIENTFSRSWDIEVVLPDPFKVFIGQYQGTVPLDSMFRQGNGSVRLICRYFHFVFENELSTLGESWRQWSADDIQMDYSVCTFVDYDEWLVPLQGKRLFPIAAIDTAGQNARGMDLFDILAMDFSNDKRIVAWSPLNPGNTEEVSESWSDFERCLFWDANEPLSELIDAVDKDDF